MSTGAYYEQNAVAFFESTANADMSALYEPFLRMLRPGVHILDAGCGSGRDAKAFLARGFRVTAFDASTELASLATRHCGVHVQVRTFDDVDEENAYDGIWCCASLLHIPVDDMPATLARLWRALRPAGSLYVSFKHGQSERLDAGRRFTDADESRLQEWLAGLTEVASKEVWITNDVRPERNERWLNAVIAKGVTSPSKLVTGGSDPFLPHLSKAMAGANDIALAVSFVKTTGLRLLMPDLQAALARHVADAERTGGVRILTSDYLGITDPEALRWLLLLQQEGADVRVFVTGADASFHLKAYLFARTTAAGIEGTAFIGSSNISQQALQQGLEWNYRVVYPDDAGFLEAQQRFSQLFSDPHCVTLSDGWIEDYEQRRRPPPVAIAPGSDEQEPPPEPTEIQERALEALAITREDGFRRGLVVLATGLGKTWLAAFDANSMSARRVLFVAHREEILHQAAETFLRIRPRARVGFYTGKTRDAEVDVLCASVQTLARAEHLERFSPQHFDYMVVDEFHHAAAATYRKLLGHFAPAFLLGLTATPERTDQSDILSLCDDNLVFTCGLFEGIQAQLLAPFHYYGVYDETVEYREIPWRNGKFDPEQLSNKLATLARSRHAISEWRSRGQRRTLGFCVSVRHAEYMAEQFRRAGIPAAAVYSGSPLGRAEALSQLESNEIRVLFSVDLFNEGVDLPSIDTVMMLRPTESKILFLQQLGRGLRRSEAKSHLVVLDFIGNHQSFLQKPPALFGVGNTYKDLANFARAAQRGELPLPDGCYVNYDLRIIDLLCALDSDGVASEYRALRSTLGRRPTLAEFYRNGASVQAVRRQFGGWFDLVQQEGDLVPEEAAVVTACRAVLREVESTAMNKCFKMVLLEAFLELDGLSAPPSLSELADRSWSVMLRRPKLMGDVPEAMRGMPDGTAAEWQRYWRSNPVNAWVGGNRADDSDALFRIEADRLRLAPSVSAGSEDVAADLLQELVDYRLAAYESRSAGQSANVIPFPSRDRVEVPFFPNLKIACGHFRTGRTDAEEHRFLPPSYGHLDAQRHFIARASGNSMNGGKNPIVDGDYLLLELLSPTKAGSITGSVMAIERQDETGDNQYLLRVATKSADGQYILKANNPDYGDMPATDDMRTLARLVTVLDPLVLAVGHSFFREDIPPLFGEVFNPGNWNAGHIVLHEKKAHVLLVTLNKQGKAEEHRYHDHWIDEKTFHWQSQNSTTPASKKGSDVIHQAERGLVLHLFVRDSRLAHGKGAPFTYQGTARYVSHSGSSPMSVVLSLQ